jgi:rod shape-determining protein MreC
VIKLLNFFIEIRDAIVLSLCILLSLILIVITDQDPGGPFRQITLNTVGAIGGYIFQIESYFSLDEENSRLRQDNAELAYKITQMEDALLENIRLRKLLGFREKSNYQLIAAEVIGENPHGILNGLILNEGADRGIEKSDAVLTADGLVGKIVQVDGGYSICQILLDRNSRVGARIQRNRELGIVAWDGGAMLKLLYLAKTIEVLPGDVVLTSGYSQIFPENIKIGVVVDVSLETDDMFQEITVQPAVNFNRLEEVQIVRIRESGGNGE